MKTRSLYHLATVICWVAGLGPATGIWAGESPQVPATGIERLKPMLTDTVLVADGISRCRIMVPTGAAFAGQGRRLQEAFFKASGAKIELLDATSFTEADLAKSNLIAVGNMMNNRAIAKLYSRHYCFTDALYPGKGGHEVRTIHNPLGGGHNVILLGGSDEAGAKAAVDRFLALLAAGNVLKTSADRQSVRLARLLTAQSAIDPKQKADEAFVAGRIRAVKQGLDNGVVRGQMGAIVDSAMSYYLTGDEGWLRIFRAALLRYCELAEPTADWALLELSRDPTGQYFWPWKVVMMWDNVEEAPLFTDAERLRITNLLLNITRWVADRDYFYLDRPKGARLGAPGDLRQGHPTYATLSMYFCAEYFRLYYPEIRDFEPRYADIARIFDGQANSYKSNDNGTVYSPLAPQQYLCYAMTRGELDARAERHLRALADSVIITTDNRADAGTWGDTPGYIIGHIRGLPFLAKAAWHGNDSGYRWAFNWIQPRSWGRGEALDGMFGDTWYQGLYSTDGPQAEPIRLLGVAPMMVDQGLYDFMRRQMGAAAAAQSPPMGKCFDKLSMRRNFNPADEYLLMSGLSGVLVHGHEDGNSVLRLTWRDRIWLANLGYRAIVPGEHNGLVIRRGDREADAAELAMPETNAEQDAAGFAPPPPVMPAFVALDTRADLPATAFTRTTVAGYSGADWSRSIIWRKGEYFLFFDDVAARQPGNYQLRLIWRTLGQTSLAGNDLQIVQGGESFNIKSADASRKNISIKRQDSNSEWSRYEHADGTVRILSEMQEVNAPRDGGFVYVTLLYPGAPGARAVERIGERTVRLLSGGEPAALVGLAANGSEGGDFTIEAAAYHLAREGLALFDVRRATVAGLDLQCPQPLSLQLDWSTGLGTLAAARDTEVSINATALVLNGRRIVSTHSGRLARFAVPAGTHSFKLEGSKRSALEPLLRGRPAVRRAASPPTPALSGLQERWRFQAPASLAALATGDLDRDGTTEVLLAAGKRVHALSASGREKWSHLAPARVTHVQVGGIGGDGSPKVVFTAGSRIHLLDRAGQELWRHECLHFRSALSALALADLERPGNPVILAGNERSALFAINGEGKLRWTSYKDIGSAGIIEIFADDLDGDGRAEIFVGTIRDHGATLFGSDGQKVRWKVPGTHNCAGALAGDGGKVLMIGGPERRGPVRIVEPKTGRTNKLIPVADDVIAIVPADLDGDGRQEFVTAFRTAGVQVFDAKGNLLRRIAFDSFPGALVVADLDSDRKLDIAVGAQDGKVWIVDAKGTPQGAADLRDPVLAMAVMSEADSTWLVVGTENGTVAAFACGGAR